MGGSSRVPCVQSALRCALASYDPEGQEFSSEDMSRSRGTSASIFSSLGTESTVAIDKGARAFCTSVNPDEAVAQGRVEDDL